MPPVFADFPLAQETPFGLGSLIATIESYFQAVEVIASIVASKLRCAVRRRWVVAAILGISGCIVAAMLLNDRPIRAPLPPSTRVDRIVVEKSRHVMTLYSQGRIVRTYDVAMGRGGIAPKRREDDNKTPEGAYTINGRNPRSAFHLSLRISYPDANDIVAARARGEPPGSDIMIHGIRNGLGWLGQWHRTLDWTAGCIAVSNDEIEDIWRVVADGTPVEIRP